MISTAGGQAYVFGFSSGAALAVPRSAVIVDGDKQVVYVAEGDGRYEERVVTTGRVQSDFIEILTGLQPGARVVSKGGFTLKSQKVKGDLKGHEH